MEPKHIFEQLHNTKLGESLVDYVSELQDQICDSRNWGEHDTAQGSKRLAKLLQTEIIDKINRNPNPKKSIDPNEFK